MFRKIDNYFTDKRKGIAALCAIGFAVLWAVLWNIFPMEFYSVFFADIVGSNIMLVLLSIVVLLPFFWVFTKLTKTELGFCKTVLLNILCLVAVIYVGAFFFFTDYFYWCIVAVVVHALINVWVFGSVPVREKKAPKGMNAPAPETEKAIKKQPMITIAWAAVFAFAVDAAGFGLFYIVAHIFAG